MKKTFFITALAALLGTAAISAQSLEAIEEQVDKAVHELGALTPGQMQVLIEPVTIEGTETTSRLSALLYSNIKSYAINRSNNKFRVIKKSRAIPQGLIEGVYAEYGDNIRVTLTLHQNTPVQKVLGSTSFSIPTADLQKAKIAWLPENIPTVTAVVEQNKTIEAAAAQALTNAAPASATAPQNALQIDAWLDHEDAVYAGGEEMKITLAANKDCYFKVYYVDAGYNMTLLYPNRRNKDNQLKANKERTIPESPMHFSIEAPFGQESVIIYASDKPFDIEEASAAQISGSAGSTTASIDGASLTRKITLTETPEQNTRNRTSANRQLVEQTLYYTTNPPLFAEDTLTIQKPEDMKETLKQIEDEAKKDGATFSGNDKEGKLTVNGLELIYTIQGSVMSIRVRYPLEKNYTAMAAPSVASRGAGSGYAFTMNKPANMGAAIQKARTEIEKKKGVFTGNESGGEFRVSALGAKLSGKYAVGGNITVTIEEKPGFLGEKTIESQVKQTFGAF
ncbi:hypothetical protein AGMMS49546_24920 [Spirochaetia bacterium]|nr:hypothetical protein AGMMS49546_24920 [Spirochaetia bacterium]